MKKEDLSGLRLVLRLKLRRIIGKKNLSFDEIIQILEESKVDKSEFLLNVDHNKDIKDLIEEGEYSYCLNSDNLNIRYYDEYQDLLLNKKSGKETLKAKLFYSEETSLVIPMMQKKGYRPAKFIELLALGISHPDLQRSFPVIALGSVVFSEFDPIIGPVVPSLEVDFVNGLRGLKLSSQKFFNFLPCWYLGIQE